MDSKDGGLMLRAPIRRKRNDEQQLVDRIKLKKVLGLTVCSNAALDCSPISGLLAYPAGCTIVLFNAKRQTQAYLVNTSRKAFTSVAFSRCGRYVATGECGMNPAIKVWELDAPNGNLEHCTGGNVVAEFVDHKYAVTCVAFSPTGKFLVSVGSQHDMIVNVFDWKSNLKMASNKISSKVSAVSFAEDGSYFVTVGNRHVKYWYLEGGRKYKDPVPLMGRSAILGDLRDNDFCAVSCGKGVCAESTYAITRQGHLVEFSSRRLLEKWVQCRTSNANCISVTGQFILVGCAEAIIRIFNASTLEYVTTLPRTHYLGVDVAQGIHINHIMTVPPQAKYPDCIAMAYDEQRSKVTCIYNDHSLYIWDMRDIKRVGKSHSFLYHSTCIWGVETVPYNMERELSHTLPEDSFVTCSSDDTIRVWGLEGCANNEIYRKNIYSKELLKVVYIDDDLNYIKDLEIVGDKASNNSNYDGRNGVRCIKISPELEHLASGDRSGNIRIYNLNNLQLITAIEAHESEVLCLEYSNEKIDRKLLASASRDRLIHVFDVAQDYKLLQTLDDHSSSITSIKFVGAGLNFQMISCGADKSIMFRTFQGNIFLRGTHTSGKTTLYDMEVDSNAKHILTACQDRNIRVYGTQNSKHTKTFKGSHSDEGSLIKLSLDPSGIYVATSCTDKTLAVYDYYSNECMARMYGHSELVTGLKFTNDCRHLISASGDGCIFIWQVPHDMIVTMQARLSQQRLRSGHAPIPRSISQALIAPEGIIVESPTPDLHDDHKFAMSPNILQGEVPLTPGYKLSDVGQLPQWAKRKAGVSALANEPESTSMNIPATANPTSINNLSSSPSQVGGVVPRPRNRWAQRGQIDADTLTDIRSNSESPLGSVSTTSGIAPAMHHPGFGNTQTSDYNSASSKDIMYNQTYLSEDSSIDSGMETRRELKFIGSNNAGTVPTISAPVAGGPSRVGASSTSATLSADRKPSLRFDTISNNDHDGDIEDISDGERTSSDHGMFYNNISPSTPTDFKVNAMNEEELRKSVRRQKFEKAGLTLSANGSHTASTGTGTGTSDTEDEGSTPSAENADRSLASTFGGSSECIPQASSTFLQAALPDGPDRRSISAKHNTENGKPGVSAPPTITKSYTSSKREELLKVISEAKQKLENGASKNGVKKLSAIPEVGYRSLRGSHSISDLSLAGNLDGSRSGSLAANRYAKTDFDSTINTENLPPPAKTQYINNSKEVVAGIGDISPQVRSGERSPQPQSHSPPMPPPASAAISSFSPKQLLPPQQHFFNCAAPKSVLQQNCQAMRQVQQQYPPYPHHVGVHQIHPPPGVPFMGPTTQKVTQKAQHSQQQQQNKTFSSSTLPASGSQLRVKRNPNGNTRRTPSILKHYKSCPVSPVHEEVEWSSDNKSIIITEPKRHSVYADDARTILDMIQADTEKMIEEITRKYGDLDDIGVDVYDPVSGTRHSQIVASKSVPENLAAHRGYLPMGRRNDFGFSPEGSTSPRMVRQPYVPLAPKHSFSEFYVYQEIYQCERKVSLSDILQDNPEQMAEARRMEEARFLETQRHSSASFFLTSNNPFATDRSQESLLSEEFLDDASYCNSMESILSDESDCKSAPLEQQQVVPKHPGLRNFIIHGPTSTIAAAQMVSKSYGSSPNAYGSFDYYMQQRHLHATAPSNVSPYESFDVSSYNLEKIQAPNDRKIVPPKPISTSRTYPKLAEPSSSMGQRNPQQQSFSSTSKVSDDIPTLKCKNQQYSSGVSKSISSDFAQTRWQRNTNPIQTEKAYNEKLFQKKPVKQKPPVPVKPENLKSTLTSTVESASKLQIKEPLKKSCSFEVNADVLKCNSRTASVVRKFERNLQKFEREKQAELQAKKKQGSNMRPSVSSGALAGQSCLKKVSKFDNSPSRRATSMRQKERPKISVRFNTVSQIKYTPSNKRDNGNGVGSTTTTCPLNDINLNVSPSAGSSLPADYGEKTFEMFISENGNDEHDNMTMDSLKLYTKPGLQQVVDEIKHEREKRDSKHKKNLANTEITQNPQSPTDASTSNQCKNIAKKIDIIEKLIAMEERKFEQIRLATESRMRPFECNTKQRGYVKSLTMNFDMLAKGIEKDIENEQRRILADNSDTDLCAYARHIKRNVSLPDVLESTETYALNKKLMAQQQQRVQLDSDGIEVELAKEVKADSDVDNEDEKEDESEKASMENVEKLLEGNPKTLNPMPADDSSSSIRRACSLSDLHMGNMGKGGKSNSSSQKTGAAHRNSSATRSASKRNSLQIKGSSTNLSANASMGVLNQSDSETESNSRSRSGSSGQSRSNGPTVSSRSYNSKNTNGNNNRRKGTLQTNFNNAPPQDDSSSEETQGSSSNAKPIVPPRPRNLAFDHKNKVLNSPNVVKTRGVLEAADFADLDSNGDPKSQVHNVINKLYTTTQTVLQLHANLRNCEDSLMLKELENAVIMTQNMLTNITQNKNDKNQQPNHAYSSTEQANLDNGDYMMMVNNCADLLSNFRMKHKPEDCGNS
ncbi:WD repeat domain 62 isoform X7 [Musca autumnalis]|uniref:WD repeat domain 62 isoform X7 n=1 Tax=Musca autumnalis TaxID=221902 RepID=UPI003CF17B3F